MAGLGGGTPGPDDFLADLARWSAADRVTRAAAERSRIRSLQDMAASSATWAGILLDLAEAGGDLTLSLGAGALVSGRLVGMGRDFVAVEDRRGRPVLVRTAAVTSLSPEPQQGPGASRTPGGRRRPPLELTLAGALDALAAERAPVMLRSGGECVTGSLAACGEDVLTVRVDPGGRPVYVPVGSVSCVELR